MKRLKLPVLSNVVRPHPNLGPCDDQGVLLS